MKTCTKCGEIKALTEFGKHASRHDGLRSWCKPCNRAAASEWQVSNPEKNKERSAEWRAANPDRAAAGCAKWVAANREKKRQVTAKWYSANTEKVAKSVARWRVANPEARRIYEQNRRARKLEAGGELSVDIAERLYSLQRGKCACCKKSLGDKFHRDHYMPLALGGTNTDDNMQLLCPTCNLQKNKKHPIDFMQQRGFLL